MHKRYSSSGFTLVELLIVIVIIAILAAITAVAYNGITNKAHASAVQNDLHDSSQKLELYLLDHGAYPRTTAELADAGLHVARESYNVGGSNGTYANLYFCSSKTDDNYALSARSMGSNQTYIVGSKFGVHAESAQAYGTWTCSQAGISGDSFSQFGLTKDNSWKDWVK